VFQNKFSSLKTIIQEGT